ncbi:protein kinase [Spirillospora sp. NPDC050679]
MPGWAALLPEDPRAAGPYEVVGRLGTGGQGTVYAGTGPDGALVAIKVLHSHLSLDERARGRFLGEVEAAKAVARFCTVQVLGSGLLGHRPYIVSEYVAGPSLMEAVERDGPRAGAALDRLAINTATALAAIHRAGIVHRDFKPANVLLGPDGPVVIDFGIARALTPHLSTTSQVVGSPSYMAPEQISNAPVGPAADMFAWGVTMVYAAGAVRAFGGDSIPGIMQSILHDEPDLGPLAGQLRDIVGECLAKEPEGRPTAEQVTARLLEQTSSTAAPPAGAATRPDGQRKDAFSKKGTTPGNDAPPRNGASPTSGTSPGSGTPWQNVAPPPNDTPPKDVASPANGTPPKNGAPPKDSTPPRHVALPSNGTPLRSGASPKGGTPPEFPLRHSAQPQTPPDTRSDSAASQATHPGPAQPKSAAAAPGGETVPGGERRWRRSAVVTAGAAVALIALCGAVATEFMNSPDRKKGAAPKPSAGSAAAAAANPSTGPSGRSARPGASPTPSSGRTPPTASASPSRTPTPGGSKPASKPPNRPKTPTKTSRPKQGGKPPSGPGTPIGTMPYSVLTPYCTSRGYASSATLVNGPFCVTKDGQYVPINMNSVCRYRFPAYPNAVLQSYNSVGGSWTCLSH